MSETETEWNHAGISKVKGGRVRIPDEIFKDTEILTVGRPVDWSYEKTVKILIASNQELEDEDYETVSHRDLGGKSDNYRCTIPTDFFEEGEGRGNPDVSPSVPDGAQVENGEDRHFIYSSEMAEGDTRSCYLLTDEQFSKRFEDSDRWGGTLSQVPRFAP
jgi:hypothetical protein